MIRTQNKEGLVDATFIYIVINHSGKVKFSIYAQFAGQSMNYANTNAILGSYPDKAAAINELDNMTQFFIENPHGIYQMR